MSLGPIPSSRLKNLKDVDKWSSLSLYLSVRGMPVTSELGLYLCSKMVYGDIALSINTITIVYHPLLGKNKKYVSLMKTDKIMVMLSTHSRNLFLDIYFFLYVICHISNSELGGFVDNTLASHPWGLWFKPPTLCGKVGSLLTNARQFTVQNID